MPVKRVEIKVNAQRYRCADVDSLVKREQTWAGAERRANFRAKAKKKNRKSLHLPPWKTTTTRTAILLHRSAIAATMTINHYNRSCRSFRFRSAECFRDRAGANPNHFAPDHSPVSARPAATSRSSQVVPR